MSLSKETFLGALDVLSSAAGINNKKKKQPRVCTFCDDKAVGKYFLEPEEGCLDGYQKVCKVCAKDVERLGYNVEYYKYLKKSISQVDLPDCDHDWYKHSLVTEDGGFDWMKCTKCDWYGKRFGVGQHGISDLIKNIN